tara:strand:- start:786 stop:2327 length:1542 start_codon:yes stop_codon:yes gene_type:complete
LALTEIFEGKVIPSGCNLVGYTWLVNKFNIKVPVRTLSCLSEKRLSSNRELESGWVKFDSQITLENSVFGHLEFAMKHEDLDLLVMKKILMALNEIEVSEYVKSKNGSLYSRRIWFLYEYFLEKRLDIPDNEKSKYENILDDSVYVTRENTKNLKRYKIKNNLLGNKNFCPIIKKTPKIERYLESDLKKKAMDIVGSISPIVLQRASSFMLLADSKASFEIEGERPPRNRIERWGKIINEAGKNDLSLTEIERLHAELIRDNRFISLGLRSEGVFLGDRDYEGKPIPEFIGADEERLADLVESWLDLHGELLKEDIDPIIHAAIIAFSFVYIHPLEDGNGRIHRYIIHHVLAERKFSQNGLVFPISSVIKDNIAKYKDVLTNHSKPLMDYIEWETTAKLNVKALNNTDDMYRFFDCTEVVEFLFECAEKTIVDLLPKEIQFLDSFDRAFEELKELIEMPDSELKKLITFISSNDGKLSKRKKEKYFEKLTDTEQIEIEKIVSSHFRVEGENKL